VAYRSLVQDTGYIVHTNGPFGAGHWQDLRVARNWLHHDRLPRVEYYLADHICRDPNGPSVTREELPAGERTQYDKLMAHHETINRRFKEWNILQHRFHHGEELHSIVFQAIAASIVQLQIEDGAFVWRV
jgi:hypothetical protein